MFKRITLQRTACFGTCPEYRIEIDSTGKVLWQGEKYVAKPGSYEWTLSREKVNELNSAIGELGYKNYVYNNIGGFKTDFPSAITSVLFNDGYFKKVNHYLGDTLEDNRLTEFENNIDRIAGTENYIYGKRNRTINQKASNMSMCYYCPYYRAFSGAYLQDDSLR